MIDADMDFFSLYELTDVICDAAMDHERYLNNPDIAEALMAVAQNIENAHKRLWQPEDCKTASRLIDEVKAEIAPKTPRIVQSERMLKSTPYRAKSTL